MDGYGSLHFDALITDASSTSWFNAAERRVLGFLDKAVREVNKVDDSFERLAT